MKKNIEKEESSNEFKNKLYEGKTLSTKLDFNPELLNKHFLKSIESYLNAQYKLNIEFAGKYLTKECKLKLSKEIESTKNYAKNENVIVEIISVDIISQNLESIFYVTDLIMQIKVKVNYISKNIYIGTQKEVREIFLQKVWFILNEEGWVIKEYMNKNYL